MRPLFAIIITSFFIASCEGDKSSYLPGYTGNEGELVVVMKQSLWDSPTGDSLASLLSYSMPGLPQEEPILQTVFVAEENFSRIFQTHRNLLFINNAAPVTPHNPVSFEKNNFAKDQLVAKIHTSKVDLLDVFTKNFQRIIWNFHQQEINRLVERNGKFGDKVLNEKFQQATGIAITSQKDSYIAKEYGSLVWLRIERERPLGGYQHQISQGLLVWSAPYTDTTSFLDTNVIYELQETMKNHLPGPTDTSYMTVSYRMQPPVSSTVLFHGSYAKEFRGLWRMHNSYMGGPFYLLTFLDEFSGRQYYALGYVFAPQFNKLPFLREVEAMAKSLSFFKKEGQ